MTIVELEHVSKSFEGREILKSINLQVKKGDMIAIKGKSGAGKSTLLNIIAGLEKVSSGSFRFTGTSMEKSSSKALAKMRSKHIGYISQFSPMISHLTAKENILVPTLFHSEQQNRILDLKETIEHFELNHVMDTKVKKLSGGEIQRVAILRALIRNPSVIVADEPTGSLDDETTERIMSHLKELSSQGICVIIATHSAEVAKWCERIFTLTEKGVFEESRAPSHMN